MPHRLRALSLLLTASIATIGLGPAHAGDTVATYLERIRTIDQSGPTLHAVLAVNPDAAKEELAARAITGPLAGKVILVKDNIEVAGPLPTTAGSWALHGNVTGRDAPLIARLRKAGVVILGKTNLSEWANMRSGSSSSGWSGVGGQTRNPHALDRSPCGSSSGSGAGVAAGLAWAAIGTETDGSVTCPASANGIVGFKPTLGLVSRTHVVPLSHSQDTPGPMATSVADAALLLNGMAGSDPLDPATLEADKLKTDFTAGLATASLKGVRIGVLRKQAGTEPKVQALFDKALADLKAGGAELVEIDYAFPADLGRDELTVLLFDLREDMGAYLRGLPGNPPLRSLADLIAFNKAHADLELHWFGQDLFESAEKTTDRAAYEKARANSLRLAGVEGIDKLLATNKVSFLVAPTSGPAWPIDLVTGDHDGSGVGAGTLAAVAGYPHLSVPMGAVEGLPIGLSIIGAKWDDAHVLQAGAAYERARTVAVPVPSLKRWGD
ncbi:amidase [Novosphingobium sp. FKTRR1]|uniref:amidase n=1 Tax=Novosphingobium sp. FKTRR1 TaxID=2879118 RepID=UPI001CF03246|nr:amidase [Novosphingobium sp. FKTRR1]